MAKTVADLFRYRRTFGDLLPVEGLRQALRQRKATTAQIAREAQAVAALLFTSDMPTRSTSAS